MRKLILLTGFLLVFIFGYSQTSVIRPYVNAGLLNGQLSTYYLDTSSTAQGKSGLITFTGGLTMGADADPGGDFTAWGTGAKSTYLKWDDDANSFGRLIVNNASFRQYNLRSINETSAYIEMRQDVNTDATPASNIALWGAAKLDAGITNLSGSGYAEGTGIKGSYYIDGTLNGDAINISGIKGEIHGTTGVATLVDNIAAVSAKYNTTINPTTGDNSLFWGWSHAGVVDYGLKLEATDGGSITTDILLSGGATIHNTSADLLTITEDTVNIDGILTATGNISGTTEITLDTDPTISLSVANCRNKVRFNNDADVIDYTLPGAAAGLVVMFYDIGGGVITIDPVDGTDTIYLNGTSVGAGDAIDSPGAVGDFICLMAIDATRWVTMGRSGLWIDSGAD